MASSKVMATTSTTNPDLSCQPSPICSTFSSIFADLQNQHEEENPGDPSSSSNPQSLGSMNMDDLLKNIYATPPPEPVSFSTGGASMTREGCSKSVDEVWKEIVAGGGGDQRRVGGAGEEEEEMTLEDFLTKAGAVREEDVRSYENNNNNIIINNNNNKINNNSNNNSKINSNNNNQVVMVGPGGRGKRRVIEEPPLDKATQQKQRRMIKNRESAARSRERKQAYTVELESQVTQLEEENSRMGREEAEQNKKRLNQLMQNLIPIVEKRKPRRVLRRVRSLQCYMNKFRRSWEAFEAED
ncbi:hypothetical protein LWI29_016719 [Acer saccharum]|uniref:BZIP domain-containing protein n=1 Tax=Acer saccharum TaxID=4024 RepID=A0AA39VQU5_ACESA|nr:hypothetical protein LWI29_016719 [Acer saccharum]